MYWDSFDCEINPEELMDEYYAEIENEFYSGDYDDDIYHELINEEDIPF